MSGVVIEDAVVCRKVIVEVVDRLKQVQNIQKQSKTLQNGSLSPPQRRSKEGTTEFLNTLAVVPTGRSHSDFFNKPVPFWFNLRVRWWVSFAEPFPIKLPAL
jgi:hypothetical protein